MKPLSAWSLRTKLWLALGGLFFILLVGSAVSAAVLTHFSRELQRLLRENYDSERFCQEMVGALDRLDAAARQLAWSEGGAAVDVAQQQRVFEENLSRQVNNVSLPGELEKTQSLAADWSEYRGGYVQLYKPDLAGRQQLYTLRLAPIYQRTRDHALHIAALNMHNVVSADGRVRRRMLEVRNVLLVLVGIGAVLAAVVLAAAGATVLQPLRDLTHSARSIGGGDLDMAVPVRSADEVGQLAEAFNLMAGRLREYRQIDHERLLRAQHTTQLAIDSLPDAVLVVSPEGSVEIANRAARTHFRAEPGRNLSELKLDWLLAIYKQAARGEIFEPRGYSSAVQLFDEGNERFFLPRGLPMFSGETVVGVAIILVDVTRLRQADEFKSNLVATVSHELRTPLTSIRMSTLLLAKQEMGPLSPRQRTLVEAARDEGERLYRTIENMLDFSRSQIGASRLRARAVEIRLLVADALAPLHAGFQQKEIHVEQELGPGDRVLADPALAASVLTNLLSNALKFTPAGGTVRIISLRSGDRIELAVSDTGPGIPPEHAKQLFERFYRAPGTDGTQGTGLGLAIARQIVEVYDGKLTYRTGPKGGSIFEFSFPAATEFDNRSF